VLDFGIARLHELSQPSGTTAGTFMGTPSFMSPEQARGRWAEVDARSDLWAVGATMFYLLTGQLVHDGDSFADQLALAVREPAPALSTIDAKLPQAVAEVVDRALAYRALDRFESARSMQDAVRAALRLLGSPEPGSLRAEPIAERRKLAGEIQTLLATPDPLSPARDRRTSEAAVAVIPAGRADGSKGLLRAGLGLLGAALLILLVAVLRWLPRATESPAVGPEARAAEVSAHVASPSTGAQTPAPSASHLTIEAAKEMSSAEPGTPSLGAKSLPPRAREASAVPEPGRRSDAKALPQASAAGTRAVPSAHPESLLDKRF
jgi:serine/threonine-protein kinase